MKNNLKRVMSLGLAIVAMVSLFSVSVQAAEVGDVIGYAQPTDIIATINGYQLQSYNVNDYTYICVEDLSYYGFDVSFDMDSRTLEFSRNYDITYIDPQNTNPDFWSIGVVTERKNILYTDIGTYANGEYISGSNINGRTIINFDELARFGEVSYDNDRREISLYVEDVDYNIVAVYADMLQEESDKEYNEYWKVRVRAKGDVLMLSFKARNYLDWDGRNYLINDLIWEDKRDARDLLYTIQTNDVPVSSIYVEYLNTDGTIVTSYQVD